MNTHLVISDPLFVTACRLTSTQNIQMAARGDVPTCEACRKAFFADAKSSPVHHIQEGKTPCGLWLADIAPRGERWSTNAREATCVRCREASGLTAGSKHDRGKRRYDLVPTVAEELVVEVLTYGADKYGVENWRSLDDWERRFYAATRRHLAAWLRGEKLDPESGLPHLAHATTNTLLMLELDQQKALESKIKHALIDPGSKKAGVEAGACPGCQHYPAHTGPGSCRVDCDCEGGRA